MTVRYTNLPDNKDKPFGGAYSVHDSDLCAHRDLTINQFTLQNNYTVDNAQQIKAEYLDTFKEWMFSTHDMVGKEDFQEACFTNGTTESFYQFYLRYKDTKRLRLAKGEYFFHQMMKALWYPSARFAWLDEDDIKEGDALLISIPFSDSCTVPDNLEEILNKCDELELPVMLDFAYLNISVALKVNLEHPCIEYIVSSLSKVFPVENHRIGIRLQRKKFEDQLYVINETNYNYINLLSAYLGTKMMQKFPAWYVVDKYRKDQEFMCESLELEVADCVYFGIDWNNKYPEYNRGTKTNRLCFSRIWDGRMKIDM